MPTSSAAGSARGTYHFGKFSLDLDREELSAGDQHVRLRPKSFAVLKYLVERHGRLVTKEELLDAVWHHSHVTDGSLTQCLIDIRRALSDEDHEIVRTVPRRGYIFELDAKWDNGHLMRDWRPAYLVAGLIAAVIAVAAGWYLVNQRSAWPADPNQIASPESIAILPFTDLAANGGDRYVADGLAEEMINSLGQLPNLRVIAGSSSFAFRDSNLGVRDIAKRLNVKYVMKGSVRKLNNAMQINVQLFDGNSGTQTWSRTFERRPRDVFTVKSEITRQIAGVFNSDESYKNVLPPEHQPNPKAYEHFLRGRFFWYRRAEGDRALAEREYRKSVEIDPAFGRGWAALAGVYRVRMDLERRSTLEWLPRYHEMLEKASQAAPNLAEVQARLADYYFQRGNRQAFDKHWAKATQLDPNDILVLGMGASWAAVQGQYNKAVQLQRRAVRINPLSAMLHGNLAAYELGAGHLDMADSEYRLALELGLAHGMEENNLKSTVDDLVLIRILQGRYREAQEMLADHPHEPARDQNLAMVYWARGREDDYLQTVSKLNRNSGWRADLQMAEIRAFQGRNDDALNLLESASRQVRSDPYNLDADIFITETRISPLLIPLRKDPRWQQLWRKWENLL